MGFLITILNVYKLINFLTKEQKTNLKKLLEGFSSCLDIHEADVDGKMAFLSNILYSDQENKYTRRGQNCSLSNL